MNTEHTKPVWFELLDYETSYGPTKYYVEAVMNDGERTPLAIDTENYERAKTQGKRSAEACNCKLRDKTSIGGVPFVESLALMKNGE